MSLIIGVLAVLLAGSVAVADSRLDDPNAGVKPTGYARKVAGKPPAFDEDRIAKFLVAARWEPIYEAEQPAPSQEIDPALEFVEPTRPSAAGKPNVVKVSVNQIERRARTTIIAVDQSGYELRPCANKATYSCLYPRPEYRYDTNRPSQSVIASASGSPRTCAEIARRLAQLDAQQRAELERLQNLQKGLSRPLK
jgi:hypothetical protein